MLSDRLESLANLLLGWIWVAPHGSSSKFLIFNLQEFQSYAKHCASESYSFPEIHEAVRLLASMRSINVVEGWPRSPKDCTLTLVNPEKAWYDLDGM